MTASKRLRAFANAQLNGLKKATILDIARDVEALEQYHAKVVAALGQIETIVVDVDKEPDDDR